MKNSIFNAVCKTRYLALLVLLIFTCGNVWGSNWTGTSTTKAPAGTYKAMVSGEAVVAGDTVIIAGNSSAMSLTQNSNNRGVTTVTVSSSTITLTNNTSVQAMDVQASNTSGRWLLHTADGYLYAPNYTGSASGNYLRTETTNKDGSGGDWAISYNQVKANGTNRSDMKLNSTLISCYSSGQTAITVYKKAHKVYYKANGGSTSCTTSDFQKSNATVTICATEPTRSNYRFTGWTAPIALTNASTSATIAAGTLIAAGTQIKMPPKDVIITAQWEADAPSYTITAASNNNSYGTVSLDGSVITATAESGYRIDDDNPYTVSPGTATVTRGTGANINKFTVSPSSNCTVTINFEEIPTHSIIFDTNGLTTISSATVREGSTYNITETPAGSLTSGCEYGTFVGWTTASSIADASVCPTTITSYTMSTSDVTLHAVYSKTSSGGTSTTNIAYSGSTTNMTGNNDAATFGLDADEWSVVGAKGGNSNFPGLNSAGDIRLYYDAAGGNTITITAPETITSVGLTFTGASYNNAWVKVGGNAVALDDGVYPINATSFVIGNANSSNTQVRILNIAVNLPGSVTYYSLSANCCDAPTAVGKGAFSAANQTMAITWTPTANNVDICYSSTSSTKPDATPSASYTMLSNKSGGSFNVDVSELAASTNYYVWARTYCSASSKSDWVALNNSGAAYFTLPSHTLTVSTTGGGTGSSVSPTSQTVVEGRNVEITATAGTGSSFSSWAVSGTGAELSSTSTNPTTFTMGTANATVTATFACITPTISSQTIASADYTVDDTPADLSVTASGGSCQWQWCATENGEYVNVTGETNASFTPPTGAISDKWYMCVVTNTDGGCNTTATSNKAHIVVNAPACTAPTSVSVTGTNKYLGGQTISLTATPSGGTGGTPTYQWQKKISGTWTNLSNGTESGVTISGVDGSNLQITPCTHENAGGYRCIVSTGDGCDKKSHADDNDGYGVHVFSVYGQYYGGDYSHNEIVWSSGTTGTATIHLNASSTYMFKVWSNDGYYYGNGNGNYIIQPVNWDCGVNNSEMRLLTGPEGDYTFTVDIEHGLSDSYVNVQVGYPSVTHPNTGYVYVQKFSWRPKVYYWYDGSHELTPYANAPDLNNDQYVNICGTEYWYIPVIDYYCNFKAYNGGDDTGNQHTNSPHPGQKLYNDGSWKWGDFTTHTITYAGNTNTGGSMTDVTGICPSSDVTLAANGFTKDDHTFAGWKTNAALTYVANGDADDGTHEVNVAVNGIVPNQAKIKRVSGNATLTAQWVHVPVLTVSESSLAFGTKRQGEANELTFTVSGTYLTGNIGIAVSGTNSAMFAMDKASLTPSDGSVSTTTVTVTYTPGSAASHSATITISTTGASDETISLTGTGRQEDWFIDALQGTSGYTELSPHVETSDHSALTLSDKSQASTGTCSEVHYHFMGWITKAKYEAGTAIADGDLQNPTTVSNVTYYAVWAKEDPENGTLTKMGSSYAPADGDDLVIVGSDYALYQETSGTYVSYWSFSNDLATVTSDDKNHIALESDGSTGWYLGDATNGYIYNGSSNNLICSTAEGEKTSFVIGWNSTESKFTIIGNSRWLSCRTDVSSPNTNKYRMGGATTGNSSGTIYFDIYKIGVGWTDYKASCPAEYDITLDKNGGTTNGSGAKVGANNTALNSGFTAPVWTGHEVDYYMVASAGGSTKIAEADGTLATGVTVSAVAWTDANGKWVKGSGATFYAKWKEASYAIAYYDKDGETFSGVHGSGYPATHTYGTATVLVSPTKEGYDFGGWYTASNCESGLVTSLGATAYTSGPINLYAKWTLKKYTVTWHVGTTTSTTANVEHGTTFSSLSGSQPAHADNALYATCGSTKFVGWVDDQYQEDGGDVDWYNDHKIADDYQIIGATDIYAMYAEASSSNTTVFSEDFSALTTGSIGSPGSSATSTAVLTQFDDVNGVYPAGEAAKLGGGSSAGSMQTKALVIPAGSTVNISFDVCGWTSVEGNILISSDNGAFDQQTVTYTNTSSDGLESKSISVVVSVANPKITIATSTKRAYIDNLVIETADFENYRTGCSVTCSRPVTAAVASITKTGATISWTDGGVGTLDHYEYKVWVSGDVEPASGTSNGTSLNKALTGLYSSTKYKWKVRKACSGDDNSGWVSGDDFTTLAANLTYSVNGDESAVTTPATTADNLNAADVPADCGSCWVFAGWTTATYAENSDAPAVLFPAGTKACVSGDATLYAVYSQEKYDWFNNISGFAPGKYVLSIITEDDPDHEWALKNELSGTDATSEDITSYVQRINYVYNPDPSFVWELSGSAGAWNLKNVAANKYLNLSGSGNILTDEADNLTIAYDGGAFPDGFNTYHTGDADKNLVFAVGNVWEVAAKVPADAIGYNYYYKRISGTYTTSPNCPKYTVTWDINNGASTSTTEVTACDGYVASLPSNPANNTLSACLTNGKFVGWSPNKVMPAQDVMPEGLFTDVDGSPEITENTTFYAVFAEEGVGSETATNTTYTFTSKSWADDSNSWTTSNDGYAFTDGRGIQVIKNGNAEGVTKNSYDDVTKVVVTYCTNSSSGAGTIVVTVGATEIGSQSATSSGGTTLRTLEYTHAAIDGEVKVSASATESSIYIYSVQIYYTGSAVTYSGYRTACCNDAAFTFVDGEGDPTTEYVIVREDLANASDGVAIDWEYSSSNATAITWSSTHRDKNDYAAAYTWSGSQPVNLNIDLSEKTITAKETGVWQITIAQAAGGTNYCDDQAVVTVRVKTVDKFIDAVNGNFSGEPQRREDVGNGITLPTEAEFVTNNACHTKTRRLVGWIKASDLGTYVSSGSTGYITDMKTSDEGTNKVIAPGKKVQATGVTWYAVWGIEE